MIFRAFQRFETGCAAYVFGCGGQGVCAVVDPRADDLEAYRAFAAAKAMRITQVLETHVHADHRSGGRALAERTGAAYRLHRSADVAFPFQPVDDGERIEIGNTIITVMHTPGHTPDSVSLLVSDLRRGPAPWFVCTGDTLFVSATGRPDLPGDTAASAAALHGSLQRLLALPDEVEVYPAHFSGSACGAGMSGKPSSTIGFERRHNPLLRLPRAAFVDAAGQGIPDRPVDMARLVAHNQGRAP